MYVIFFIYWQAHLGYSASTDWIFRLLPDFQMGFQGMVFHQTITSASMGTFEFSYLKNSAS